MRIAWVLYGDLDARTGGTIHDRIVVEGLRAAGEVTSWEPELGTRARLSARAVEQAIDDAELSRRLAAADALVLPSSLEG